MRNLIRWSWIPVIATVLIIARFTMYKGMAIFFIDGAMVGSLFGAITGYICSDII